MVFARLALLRNGCFDANATASPSTRAAEQGPEYRPRPFLGTRAAVRGPATGCSGITLGRRSFCMIFLAAVTIN